MCSFQSVILDQRATPEISFASTRAFLFIGQNPRVSVDFLNMRFCTRHVYDKAVMGKI